MEHSVDAMTVAADSIRARVSTGTLPAPPVEVVIIQGPGHHHVVRVDQELSVNLDPAVVHTALPEHSTPRLGDLNVLIALQVSKLLFRAKVELVLSFFIIF